MAVERSFNRTNRSNSTNSSNRGPSARAVVPGAGPSREFPAASALELGERLEASGFSLAPGQLELLARYHALLLERNRTLNLTRILNLDDMVLKHYVDCFLVTRFVPRLPEPLLDLGSGAGFPGIPLKILFPELHIILGEGVRKRVDFLREVRTALGLERLDLIGRNIDRDFEYPVGGVITRAVEPIRETLKRISGSLVGGGLAIFMKGPNVDQELDEARRKYGGLFALIADHAYTLPRGGHRRRLLVYRRLEVS